MHYYEVAPTRIVRAETNTFTYANAEPLEIGQVVEIPIGKTTAIGVVLKKVPKPEYETKPIDRVLTKEPLPTSLLKTLLWISEYYATPLATVLQMALPRGIGKNRRKKATDMAPVVSSTPTAKSVSYTADQTAAIKQLDSLTDGSVLLHGVTGSGKTAVYIDQATKTLSAGKSVIILVPEIALTSQLVEQFARHFPQTIVTHSNQTEAQRHLTWQKCLNTSTPTVVIGPRSALFTPLQNVGLIVVDEMHEPSFKQEQSPRYSALRTASVLGQHTHGKVIFGSATPPIADYYLATSTNSPIIIMNHLARDDATKPQLELVDMTKRDNFSRHRFISNTLFTQIENDLAAGNQVLVFHNRRGSAPTTLCENCGWQAGCPRCFVPLTLHADTHQLRCHICGYTDPVPTSCPVCHETAILHKGIGTKLIESELTKLFPKATIGRFDGDTPDAGTVNKRFEDIKNGTINILIGTQVLAKGFDLPLLRTVGVIQADAGLSLPDFGAPERTFQLLAQVVGRVGRSHHPTKVIVQSYQPNHPAVRLGIAQDYQTFYEQTIKLRQKTHFPPFCFLLKLTCIYKTEAAAIRNATTTAEQLRSVLPDSVEILGPTPAFYERQRDTYRWQLVLKSAKRHELVAALRHLPSNHWQFELDPTSLL